MPSIKLNIFQRGILQKCATVFVYMVSAATGAWAIDWLDKQYFIRLAKEAQNQNLIPPEVAHRFIILIEARDFTAIFLIMFVGLLCGFVIWLFMRWAANFNWSWPVTLPKAVEFRWAMEQLGITDPHERIAFVRKHKLHVFIALSPLVGKEQEPVRAKLYPFAYHVGLGNVDLFARHIGNQTLCLDADDYEGLLKEHGQRTDSAYSARIVDLEQSITNLKATNSLQNADIVKLTEENEKLLAKNDGLKNELKMLTPRAGKAEKRENDRIPFWLVAAPMVKELKKKAEPGTRYKRPQIQAAFLQELEGFPELKPAIQNLLNTSKKQEGSAPYELKGWGMEAIRLALGDLAEKDPGTSPKVKKT